MNCVQPTNKMTKENYKEKFLIKITSHSYNSF